MSITLFLERCFSVVSKHVQLQNVTKSKRQNDLSGNCQFLSCCVVLYKQSCTDEKQITPH